MRHPNPGAGIFLSKHVKAAIINAGDGAHEHPTQALLDSFSIRERLGDVANKNVTENAADQRQSGVLINTTPKTIVKDPVAHKKLAAGGGSAETSCKNGKHLDLLTRSADHRGRQCRHGSNLQDGASAETCTRKSLKEKMHEHIRNERLPNCEHFKKRPGLTRCNQIWDHYLRRELCDRVRHNRINRNTSESFVFLINFQNSGNSSFSPPPASLLPPI